MIEKKTYRPLKLVKNVRYPSYQLWATSANKKTPLETSMTIAILTVMAWLRERFREFDIPHELVFPESSQYTNIQLSEFLSFHINEGYSVDIVSIPEEKIWALQLLEPDLGPEPGNPNQIRKPVPGRLFETNIAFRIFSEKLECGFQTMVADPEGCKAPCEVFRLAVVKELVRNPLLGLEQKIRIKETVHKLDTMSSIKNLNEYLKDDCCGLPAVIFTEYIPSMSKMSHIKTPKQILDELPFLQSQTPISILSLMKEATVASHLEQSKPVIPYDINLLVRYKMGYAHFFTLPYNQIENFNRVFSSKLSTGDIALIEPKRYGGETRVWSYQENDFQKEALVDKLEILLQNYPMKKPTAFGNVLFAKQAKLLSYKLAVKKYQSKEELIQRKEDEKYLTEQTWRDERREAEERVAILDEKISRLEEKNKNYEEKIKQLKSENETDIAEYEKQLKEKDDLLEFYKSLADRPNKTELIPDWVEKCFHGRMIMHQKAKDLIRKTPTSEVDMKLLCNALEFLATEYRDEMEGLITREKMLSICSKKYNRPFEVTPVSMNTVEFTPNEYKIKYYIGHNGKPIESALDLHLKVGNDSENLLRIYFLYDKVKRMVVIGSLPKHLRTTQIS